MRRRQSQASCLLIFQKRNTHLRLSTQSEARSLLLTRCNRVSTKQLYHELHLLMALRCNATYCIADMQQTSRWDPTRWQDKLQDICHSDKSCIRSFYSQAPCHSRTNNDTYVCSSSPSNAHTATNSKAICASNHCGLHLHAAERHSYTSTA